MNALTFYLITGSGQNHQLFMSTSQLEHFPTLKEKGDWKGGGGEGDAIIRWTSSSSAITENSWWILTDITVF